MIVAEKERVRSLSSGDVATGKVSHAPMDGHTPRYTIGRLVNNRNKKNKVRMKVERDVGGMHYGSLKGDSSGRVYDQYTFCNQMELIIYC